MPKALLRSGIKLHYQRVGRGPDLVMVHGLTGNLAVWHLKIIPLLMDRYRILTYDLRGHGYSEMPPSGYSAGDNAVDLLDLLDALEIERPSIVGHSFGADIALYFALLHPDRVRDVVAIEAAIPALNETRAQENWEGWSYWAEVLEKCDLPVPEDKKYDAEYLLRQTLLVPKKWGPLNGLPRDPGPFLKLLETTTLVNDYAAIGELTMENLAKITPPVHLIYGDASSFAGSFEALRDRLPNATATMLPRTEWGHFGPMEQPEVVAQCLLDLLDDADAAEPAGSASAPSRDGRSGP